nr:MAG TPA_asm: hypothetical protein [Caudoviricetes sp.]
MALQGRGTSSPFLFLIPCLPCVGRSPSVSSARVSVVAGKRSRDSSSCRTSNGGLEGIRRTHAGPSCTQRGLT